MASMPLRGMPMLFQWPNTYCENPGYPDTQVQGDVAMNSNQMKSKATRSGKELCLVSNPGGITELESMKGN